MIVPKEIFGTKNSKIIRKCDQGRNPWEIFFLQKVNILRLSLTVSAKYREKIFRKKFFRKIVC